MKAVKFMGPDEPFQLAEIPRPVAGPGEVLVNVNVCGVCASDLHLLRGTFPSRADGPLTPGHEPAGTVAEVGPGVNGWSAGDRVAVAFAPRRCGECPACQRGDPPEECALPLLMGMDVDGAWAEYVVVPERALVRLPPQVSFEVGALLTDAVATPYSALVDVGGLRLGERVAVFGAGGIGLHAVQLARLGGASFVAVVEPRAGAREQARRFGADLVIDPGERTPSDAIMEATHGWGVDLAVECAGRADALAEAIATLGQHGRCVLVGVITETADLGAPLFFSAMQATLTGVRTYQRTAYDAVLRLVNGGRLDLRDSISAVFKLEEVNEAIRLLESKEGDPVRIMLSI